MIQANILLLNIYKLEVSETIQQPLKSNIKEEV